MQILPATLHRSSRCCRRARARLLRRPAAVVMRSRQPVAGCVAGWHLHIDGTPRESMQNAETQFQTFPPDIATQFPRARAVHELLVVDGSMQGRRWHGYRHEHQPVVDER